MLPLDSSDPVNIGRYSIVARLGAGATGIVYEASRDDGKRVALKVIRKELADVPQVRERLKREAESLRRVASTRCAEVIEIESEGPIPYLALELISGRDLSSEISVLGPLRGAMARTVFLSLVEALTAIHQAGVIHRDFKPSNILIGEMGVRVVDFGISAVLDVAQLTSTGVVVGTAAWMSPEQIDGRELTEATDVFNLGLVMAFCITGKHPFGEGRPDAVMYRIMHSEPELGAIAESYRVLIQRCLTKDPDQRITLAEVFRSLQSVSGPDVETAESGTVVLAPTEVERFSSERVEKTKEVSDMAHVESKRLDSIGKKKIALLSGAVATVVLIVGAISATSLGVFDQSTTTTSSTTTTTTTPVTPVFTLNRYKGTAFRWDPCSGPINVSANFGELTGFEKDLAVEAINQAIVEVAEISGLPIMFSGETKSRLTENFRDGRRGSEAIKIGFLPAGKGIISKGDNFAVDGRFSRGRLTSAWTEILAFDLQINTTGATTKSEYLRESRRALMIALGISWNESPNELMGQTSSGYTTSLNEFGPGDIQAMVAVGKSQGCIG